ncbi:MAG: ankyrin repeat domain-containing protein [Planctomycetaceae bacterium]
MTNACLLLALFSGQVDGPDLQDQLASAIISGKSREVRKLLDQKPELLRMPCEEMPTASSLAARENRVEILREMMKRGEDFGTFYRVEGDQRMPIGGALRAAAIYHSMDAARFLLENKCDPNSAPYVGVKKGFSIGDDHREPTGIYSMTPVDYAVSRLDHEMLELLVSYGGDPSFAIGTKGNALYYIGSSYGIQMELRSMERPKAEERIRKMVRYLKEHGCTDINAQDGFGQTVLFGAVKSGNAAVVKVLLEEFPDADPDISSDLGNCFYEIISTPVRHAEDAKEIIELLIEQGADYSGFMPNGELIIRYCDHQLRTALHEAIRRHEEK